MNRVKTVRRSANERAELESHVLKLLDDEFGDSSEHIFTFMKNNPGLICKMLSPIKQVVITNKGWLV